VRSGSPCKLRARFARAKSVRSCDSKDKFRVYVQDSFAYTQAESSHLRMNVRVSVFFVWSLSFCSASSVPFLCCIERYASTVPTEYALSNYLVRARLMPSTLYYNNIISKIK